MPQILLFGLATGAINQVYGCLAIGLMIILGYPILKRKPIWVNAVKCHSFWLLLSFGFAYVLFGGWSVRSLAYYLVNPIIAFMCGYCIIDHSRNNKDRAIAITIFSIALGFGIHAALNLSVNLDSNRSQLIDFFSGEARAATGSGAINTLIFSSLAYLTLVEKDHRVRVFGWGLFVISCAYAFVLGSRTQFVILLIVFIVVTVLYTLEMHDRCTRRRVFRRLATMAIVAILVYVYDIFDIRTYIESSNLLKRFEDDLTSSNSYRLAAIGLGLKSLIDYPFGGQEGTSYFHNMWLDIGRIAGVLPFVLMVLFNYLTVAHAVRIFRDRGNSVKVRYLVLTVYMGMLLNLFVEPILEGLLDFFYIFCIVNGMTECYYFLQKKRTENK